VCVILHSCCLPLPSYSHVIRSLVFGTFDCTVLVCLQSTVCLALSIPPTNNHLYSYHFNTCMYAQPVFSTVFYCDYLRWHDKKSVSTCVCVCVSTYYGHPLCVCVCVSTYYGHPLCVCVVCPLTMDIHCVYVLCVHLLWTSTVCMCLCVHLLWTSTVCMCCVSTYYGHPLCVCVCVSTYYGHPLCVCVCVSTYYGHPLCVCVCVSTYYGHPLWTWCITRYLPDIVIHIVVHIEIWWRGGSQLHPKCSVQVLVWSFTPWMFVQSNLVRKSLFTTSTSLQQQTWQGQIQCMVSLLNVPVITTTCISVVPRVHAVNKFDCTYMYIYIC
jgi:hypothetical protein